MAPDAGDRRPDTFVIQVTPSVGGDMAGLIRHVRTGEKRRFDGLEGLKAAILLMVRTPGRAHE